MDLQRLVFIVHSKALDVVADGNLSYIFLQSYDVNSRGLEIFSKSWVPDSRSPKAVVCYCHGYGDTCTFFFEGM